MSYYFIKNSSEAEEIGCFPQANIHKEGYNPGPPDGHWQVQSNSFPDFIPKVDLMLNKKAKITNGLSTIISNAFIVDRTIKEILEKHNLPKHQFYPVNIYRKGMCLEYFWFFYVIDDFWEHLDKKKSRAVIFDNHKDFEIIADLDLNLPPESFGKLQFETLPYHQHIRWEKIVFKPTLPKYDFYQTQSIQHFKLASKKLIDAIKYEAVTGLTFSTTIKAFVQ